MAGGLNLYGYVGNGFVNSWDLLGLAGIPMPPVVVGLGRREEFEEYDADGCLYRVTLQDMSSDFGIPDMVEVERTLLSCPPPIDDGWGWGGGGGGGGDAPGSGSPSTDTNNAREQLRKDCEGLRDQMYALTQSFNRSGVYHPPSNPMSLTNLRSEILRKLDQNIGGLIDAVGTLTPSGLVMQTAAFAGSVTQMQQLTTGGDSSLFDVVSYTASFINYMNFYNTMSKGMPLVTGAVGAAARASGYAGAAITLADVLGEPLVDYVDRNTGTQPWDLRIRLHEWTTNGAPRIEALVGVYNGKECGSVLGK